MVGSAGIGCIRDGGKEVARSASTCERVLSAASTGVRGSRTVPISGVEFFIDSTTISFCPTTSETDSDTVIRFGLVVLSPRAPEL